MAAFANVVFWTEFIETYKNLPQLWKIKGDMYHNKQQKLDGYNILKEKLSEVESNVTIDIVKRKINSLRCSYRRELKKVQISIKSGAGANDVYVPTLWYYNLLAFLENQECQLDGESSIDIKSENDPQELSPQPKKPKRSMELQQNEPLLKTVNSLENSKDEVQILSDSWGCLYRKLDPHQQLFANKAINEVLYQGALGKLHETSHKAFEKQSNIATILPQTFPRSVKFPSRSTTSFLNKNDRQIYDATPMQSPQSNTAQPVAIRFFVAQPAVEDLNLHDFFSDLNYQ